MNKSFFTTTIALILIATTATRASESAITNVLNGGRLGDQLINYTKTLWLAHTYKLDFFYTPFTYSAMFKLDAIDKKITSSAASKFTQKVRVKNNADINLYKNVSKVLYVSDLFFTDSSWGNSYVVAMRKDPEFIAMLRERIAPKDDLELVTPPGDCVSVAVHIRRGGGFDRPCLMQQPNRHLLSRDKSKYVDVSHPYKFSPDSYHLEQLRKIAEYFPGQKIYAYMFTDDQNPAKIADDFSRVLNNPCIEFDYRKKNAHDANVLEDLFSMLNFDCLIRTESAFSQMAHLIGAHKIVFWPEVSVWDKTNTLLVTKVGQEIHL